MSALGSTIDRSAREAAQARIRRSRARSAGEAGTARLVEVILRGEGRPLRVSYGEGAAPVGHNGRAVRLTAPGRGAGRAA